MSVFSSSVIALGLDPSDAATVALAKGAESNGTFDKDAFTARVSRTAEIRQVWDAGKLDPLILGGIKNGLNGLQFGFGIPPAHIATAFVTHGESNVLLYGTSAWTEFRLGSMFNVRDPGGNIVTTNVFAPARAANTLADPNDPNGFYQDAAIVTLQRRGVMCFCCNTALVEQAKQIVAAGVTRGTVEDVALALRRSLLPGVTLVPSGVAAIALLQSRFHYGYVTES